MIDKKYFVRFNEEKNGDYTISYGKGGGLNAKKVIGKHKAEGRKKFKDLIAQIERDGKENLEGIDRDIYISGILSKRSRWYQPTHKVGNLEKEDFPQNSIGNKAYKFYRYVMTLDHSRDYKLALINPVMDLSEFAGNETRITKTLISSYFKSVLNRDVIINHTNQKKIKTALSAFLEFNKTPNRTAIIEEIKPMSKKEYLKFKKFNPDRVNKVMGNDHHFERDDILRFFTNAINHKIIKGDYDLINALLIQFWIGCRPNSTSQLKINKYSATIVHSKTQTETTIAKNNLLNAFLYLLDFESFEFSYAKGSKRPHEVFKLCCSGFDGEYYNRYNIRHTALTWLVRSSHITIHEVAQMAGHASLQMLDSSYASRDVKDTRSWEDVIGVEGLPLNYHGFLIYCLVKAIWPDINKEIPNSEKFTKFISILKDKEDKKEKKVSLF